MDPQGVEPRIWLITGPTASGKTALALRLARSAGGEIVNADSMQLYRDLRVLTARPSPEEMQGAPHHLFGVADAADGWSVGRWLRAALPVLADIAARGRIAVVVGGTGLYFAALTRGLADTPPVPPGARREAEALYEAVGEAEFRRRAAQLDPDVARISPGDRQRLVRLYEVATATGAPLGALKRTTAPALTPGSWRGVVLEPPRAALYARCDARLAAMFEGGAVEEARALLARGLAPSLPAMKAVGVRELGEHLAGRASLSEALARAQQQTRRYAKRQLTWFRNQTPDWPRITALEPEAQGAELDALTGMSAPTRAERP
jgi:tRNA dimethylallyltransferase